jgi:hypothetical protein
MKQAIFLFAIAFALASPPAAAASSQLAKANDEGNKAYNAKDFPLAAEQFALALKLSTDEKDQQYQAIAMYGLARSSGQLCRVAEAEDWFKQSIAAREKVPDGPQARVTQNLLEYSRFLLAQKRFEDAAPLMTKAYVLLEKLGAEQADPIAYADFLDQYVSVLHVTGRAASAEVAAARSSGLRTKYAGQQARFKPDPFPTCSDAR